MQTKIIQTTDLRLFSQLQKRLEQLRFPGDITSFLNSVQRNQLREDEQGFYKLLELAAELLIERHDLSSAINLYQSRSFNLSNELKQACQQKAAELYKLRAIDTEKAGGNKAALDLYGQAAENYKLVGDQANYLECLNKQNALASKILPPASTKPAPKVTIITKPKEIIPEPIKTDPDLNLQEKINQGIQALEIKLENKQNKEACDLFKVLVNDLHGLSTLSFSADSSFRLGELATKYTLSEDPQAQEYKHFWQEKSLQSYLAAAIKYKDNNELLSAAGSLSYCGQACLALGRTKDAQRYYAQALAIYENAERWEWAAICAEHLEGLAYDLKNDMGRKIYYQKAISYHEKAEAERSKNKVEPKNK